MGQLILQSGAPILGIRLCRSIPGPEVECLSIRRGRVTIGECSRKCGNTDLSLRGQGSGRKRCPIDNRILSEPGWGLSLGKRHSAVEAKEVLTAEVVLDRRTVRNSVTSTKHQVLVELVGKTDARPEFFEVPVLEGVAVDAG